ncbi:MAG: NosD domain-containing protein [Candidatus Thorarchaeota archaeon]
MRNRPLIIFLVVTLFLNTNIQSCNAALTILTSNHMASSDSVLPEWFQELQEHETFRISSDDDFVDQGWAGNGSESNPFIIEGLVFRTEFYSIAVEDTTKHFEIRRCLFTNIDPHIDNQALIFQNVTNGRVTNCFINETFAGIILGDSTDCQFTDNIVFGNFFGAIFIEGGLGILIANNTIHDAGFGISLIETTDFTIQDNRIYECYRGMFLLDVQSCTILGNMIWRNTYGIDLTRGNSTIMNNTIYGNTEIGIRVSTGIASNMIYGNHIGWNGVQNAEDNSISTIWDDTMGIGNNWSDYSGTGQYPIPGSASSYDQWPLILVDNVVPVVDSPIDVDFEFGCTGQSVSWSTSDEFPLIYQILRGEDLVETGTWTGQIITMPLDELLPGTHSLMLQLWDAQGNYAMDQVSVYVLEAEPPVINHPSDIEYVVGDTGYNITWIPEDAYPDHYEIFINVTLYKSGDWNGSEILVFVDGHDIGLYNFSLVVYDSPGQTSIDVVFVSVLAHSSEPPPDYFGFVLFLLGIGMVGFIITFSILYTSTPFLKRFKGESDSEDDAEILAALEEFVIDKNEPLNTGDNDTSFDVDVE